MNLIFLDIDGVLNTYHSMSRMMKSNRLHRFQKSCVRELNRLTRKTGALIVVSSVWRLDSHWVGILQHLQSEGVAGDVIGRTGRSGDRIRGHEIQDWLDEHAKELLIDSFVILDDDSDMDHLSKRLVQTSLDGGLRRYHTDSALQILNRRWAAKSLVVAGEGIEPSRPLRATGA